MFSSEMEAPITKEQKFVTKTNSLCV